jgi:hypothetical protein
MKPAQNTTPADFGVWEVAYKVSETDFNMKRSLAKAPVNEWAHQDDVVNVKTQQVVRENQDVIYSSAVVDIREGATISVPKSDNYHIIQILDMQNYTVEVLYPGESAAITPDRVTYGSYVYLNMRIRKLPEEKGGLQTTHKLQRMARIEAKSAIPYASPDIVVDPATLEKVRRALVKDVYEGKAGTDTSASMGTPYDTDPQLHLYATAYGWGGLAIAHAGYVPITRNQTKIEDGKALPSSLTFTPPEIDEGRGGFWSVITYDAEGWIARDKASICNSEVAPNADGSCTFHFNSPGKANNLDTPAPFVALLRVYVPRSKEGIVRYMAKAGELVIQESP